MGVLEKLQAEAEFGELVMLNYRVPAPWLRDVDAIAEKLGLSRSEVARQSLLAGLRDVQSQMADLKKPQKRSRASR